MTHPIDGRPGHPQLPANGAGSLRSGIAGQSAGDDVRAALRDAHRFWLELADRSSWVPGYLEGRGLAQQRRLAGIGHAPAGWTTTVNHLRGLGHDDELLVDAGLAFVAGSGHLLDVFRDRLIFPVVDAGSRLVGFAGRAAPGANPGIPKYLNSPTTTLFHKRSLLHGLGEDRSRLKRGDLPVIVEGPMDRLAINQAAGHIAATGLAPCGTALTHDQVAGLTGLIGPQRPIALCYDNDRAGREATLRAWKSLTTSGSRRQLLQVELPGQSVDAADLVGNGQVALLRAALIRPRPLALHVADIRIENAGRLDHVGKTWALLEHLLGHDLPHVHPGTVARYIHHLSRRLDIPDADVTAAAVRSLDHHTGLARRPRARPRDQRPGAAA